ncbi:MAG: GWxTD domain-containing protein [Gemmatimonadetes bacterium]|nr:GWxTD domain-containing protein [Gemmatimonadota bacterium]MCB9518340.1 GWxTD domain-containing protein [Gemmatimonadales bacterium]MCA9763736.1 GWxTD domain-containing protein [Gemmatimonadota bacterium]MCA9768182.1 GWxTD domain-containing protein [Gemmatimonadota bacterium]HPF62004.1 GWxTD domain-containing protein [Gemmatimonadales bacterium]
MITLSPRSRPGGCHLLLALLCAAAPVTAQSPAERQALERFRDSLATIQEVAGLRTLEAELIGRARTDRDNAMLHLRLGFVALRLGQVAGEPAARRHYDEAGGEFEWAIQVKPDWPYGWYGLGLAELGVGNSEVTLVEGFQTMLGKDALTRSANAFAQSAAVDPTFELGLVELSNTALRQRINARMDVALAALRRAGRTGTAAGPGVLLARARIERRVGSLDSSRAALQRILARDSTDAVARFELARTLLLTGDSTAAPLWYDAIATGDSTVTALARTDLDLVLPDSTAAAFDAATPDARVALLRAFWQARDDDALHRRGERLAEHYRRLDYARRAYRLVSENRQFDIAERYRSGQTEYDDRGVAYIRHGEPDERAQYSAPGIEPNESWLYRRDDGDLLLHFVARQDVQDFRLVESLLDVLGFATALSLRDSVSLSEDAYGGLLRQRTEGLLRSRQDLDPVYSRMLGAGRGGNAQLMTEERTLGRRSIARAMSTDSWPLDPGPELDASVVLLAVGSDHRGAAVQLAYAIPGEELTPRESEGTFAYPVRTRIAIQALDGTTVLRADSTRGFVLPRPLAAGELLLGHQAVEVPPGIFTVRMSVETDDGGMVSTRDTLRVPSPLGPDLGLSDIAMGVRSVPLPWVTATGDTAWINPLSRYRRAEPLHLYFEVTGLPPGAPYRTRLTVRKPGGGIFRKLFGGGKALELTFEQVHPGGVDRILREVSLERVSPGEYRLEVTVSTEDGREASRFRTFTVRD